MLIFIIPLKSPEISKSWELVSKLFERSIKSICNQTSEEFKIIVVCNEKPIIDFQSPAITYVYVDFPLPEQQLKDLNLENQVNWRGISNFSKNVDKGRKILTGLSKAKQFNPSHIMVVDADDCVHKNLAKFVSENKQDDGWYIKQGYLYHEHQDFLQIKFKDFYKTCGSSIIIKPEFLKFMFNNYIYDHINIVSSSKIKLKPLPFKGAIYSVGNQENIFQTVERQQKRYKDYGIFLRIKNIFRVRPINNSIYNNFKFYNI